MRRSNVWKVCDNLWIMTFNWFRLRGGGGSGRERGGCWRLLRGKGVRMRSESI